MKKRVAIDFCCNDPDNGEFAGKVIGASYADCELENGMQEYKFTAGDGFIRIHRRNFKTVGRVYWLGNWCWDRFWFSRSEAKRLIGHLRKNGWRCTGGPVRLADWWNGRAA